MTKKTTFLTKEISNEEIYRELIDVKNCVRGIYKDSRWHTKAIYVLFLLIMVLMAM